MSKIVGDRKGKDKVALLASDTSIPAPESVNWIEKQVLVANNLPTTDNDTPGVCFDEAAFDFYSVWVCNVYSLSNPNVDKTSIVIDSGGSSSVCSTEEVNKMNPSLLPKLDNGPREFRFGDSRSFDSVGIAPMRGKLPINRLGNPCYLIRLSNLM